MGHKWLLCFNTVSEFGASLEQMDEAKVGRDPSKCISQGSLEEQN